MEKFATRGNFFYNRIGSYSQMNPYMIAYVYPRDEAPFIVKGGCNDVDKVIKNYKKPAVVHESYWQHGKARYVHVKSINTGLELSIFPKTQKRTKVSCGSYKIGTIMKLIDNKQKDKYGHGKTVLEKRIRRIPRSWIKEIDDYM